MNKMSCHSPSRADSTMAN